MKRWISAVIGAWLCAAALAAAPRTLVLYGPVTNTTGDDVTANVRLVLTIEGENVSGEMKTEAPLVGTGKVQGRMIGAWCELRGKMEEGFDIAFRGAVNDTDFRGTYIAAVPGEPVQYGKFQLMRETAARPARAQGAAETGPRQAGTPATGN